MFRHYSDTATYAPRQPSMLGPGRNQAAVQSKFPLSSSPCPAMGVGGGGLNGDLMSLSGARLSRARGTVSLPTSPLGRSHTAQWDDLHPQTAVHGQFAELAPDAVFWPILPTYDATSQHQMQSPTSNDLNISHSTDQSSNNVEIGIDVEQDYPPDPLSSQPTADSFSPTQAPCTGYEADIELDLHSGEKNVVVPGPRRKRAQVRVACTHCQKACKKCSDTRPCERCIKYKLKDCIDSSRKPRKTGVKRGPYKRRVSKTQENNPPLPSAMISDSKPIRDSSQGRNLSLRYPPYENQSHSQQLQDHQHLHQQQYQNPYLPDAPQYGMYLTHFVQQGNITVPSLPQSNSTYLSGVSMKSATSGLTAGANATVNAITPTSPLTPQKRSQSQIQAHSQIAVLQQQDSTESHQHGVPPSVISHSSDKNTNTTGVNDPSLVPLGGSGTGISIPPPLSALQGAFANALATGPRWVNGRRMHLSISSGKDAGTLEPTCCPPSGGAFPLTLNGGEDPFSRAVSPIHMHQELADYIGHLPFNNSYGGHVQPHSAVGAPGPRDGNARTSPSLNVNVSFNNNDDTVPPYSALSTSSGPYHSPFENNVGGDNAGRDSEHSPAIKALQRIRKPSLYTLMSAVSSASASRSGSPILQQQQQLQQSQSPTLYDQPLDMDLDAEPSWANIESGDLKKGNDGDQNIGVASGDDTGGNGEGKGHGKPIGSNGLGEAPINVDGLGLMGLEGPFHDI